MQSKRDAETTAQRAALNLEGATIDEVKGVVMTIDARGEETATRMGVLEGIIGHPSKPGTFAGDPGTPGSGMAGTLERLAKSDFARGKAHAAIAARTGGLTALVLAIVLKVAEIFLSSRSALPLPAIPSALPQVTSHP
jgi:hypothetical protein